METKQWHRLLNRVEILYEKEKERFANYTVEELRHFIIERKPFLRTAVSRVPTGAQDGAGETSSHSRAHSYPLTDQPLKTLMQTTL